MKIDIYSGFSIGLTLLTRSSAVVERPRDASCHWIFC